MVLRLSVQLAQFEAQKLASLSQKLQVELGDPSPAAMLGHVLGQTHLRLHRARRIANSRAPGLNCQTTYTK